MGSAPIEPKDQLTREQVLGEAFMAFRSEAVQVRLFSPDLQRIMVETSVGLAVGLEPPQQSFFQASLDDDTSYKLLCSLCLGRLGTSFTDPQVLCCTACAQPTSYPKGSTSTLWMCESGIRLSISKAEVRQERSGGTFQVANPEELAAYLTSFDFVKSLVDWLDPHADALQTHLIAWDLADILEQIWVGWKAVRRNRRPGKRLAGYRILEEAFNDPAWQTWTRYPARHTGEAVPVPVKTEDAQA